MLLLLMEEGWPLDEVVFYDTGMEFEAIYHIRGKIVPLLEKKGVKFTELYPGYDFVSCWCCANKNLKELRNIYLHLPEYWRRLEALQYRTDRPMKGKGKSVFELKGRFEKERK